MNFFFLIFPRKLVLSFHAICMKVQSLFSGKIRKKYFKLSSANIFTQHAKLNTKAVFESVCLTLR